MPTDAAAEPAGNSTGTEVAVAGCARHAASFGAIVAGALVAVAVGTMLTALGSAVGISFIDPWDPAHADATTVAIVVGALWLLVVQFSALAIGAYIALRLRQRGAGPLAGGRGACAFDDAAHGLAVWALTALLAAMIVAGTVTSIAGTAAHNTAPVALAKTPTQSQPNGAMADGLTLDDSAMYYLLRLTAGQTESTDNPAARPDILIYLKRVLTNGALDAADRTALTVRLSALTGLPPGEAQRRIGEVEKVVHDARARRDAELKEVAAAVAKSTAYLAAGTFLIMLIGMLGAIFGARVGGRDARAAGP